MPWPLALLLAIWCTELIVLAAWLPVGCGPLPPERAWTEEDEAEWRDLLRQEGWR